MEGIEILYFILIIVFAYFFGNISFAKILAKKNNSDITKQGSGNPGTMNMLRSYGVKLGALTLVLDVLKGAIPAVIGFLFFANLGLFSAGLAVMIGHVYPVLYKFKGGKGVACTIGVFLVAEPLWLFVFFVVGFIYLYFFDYGAISSFIVVTALTILEAIKNADNFIVCILIYSIFILIWFAHRSNITRLLVGKENKVNFKKMLKKIGVKDSKKIEKSHNKININREIG